jgi:hypothetical protein
VALNRSPDFVAIEQGANMFLRCFARAACSTRTASLGVGIRQGSVSKVMPQKNRRQIAPVFYSPEDRKEGLPQEALAAVRETGRFNSEGWRIRKGDGRFWALVVLDAIRNCATS